MREKLIELLTASAPYALPSNVDDLHLLLLADELLSRGVTVQKHGRWLGKQLDNFRFYQVTCSECEWVGFENYDSYNDPSGFDYCPNCGTKMDGDA